MEAVNYFKTIFGDSKEEVPQSCLEEPVDYFCENDIEKAINSTNFKKALGEDWMNGEILKNKEHAGGLKK
jgi:hypothetical protein